MAQYQLDFIYKPTLESLKRVLPLFLIIVQSCGIRFFEGQGAILMIAVICTCLGSVRLLRFKDINFLILVSIILMLIKFANPEFDFSKLIFQYGLVLQSFLFLVKYRTLGHSLLIKDFYSVLSVIFLHSAVGYILFLLIPSQFSSLSTLTYSYSSLFNLFFVSVKGGSLARNTGILWEPGLLQLMLNLFLFYSIIHKKSLLNICLVILLIITTFSTSGFVILLFNIGLFIFGRTDNKARLLINILYGILLTAALYTTMSSNIIDKVGGENTSGLIRFRDFSIGLELIKEKPILGHGIYDSEYLLSKSYVQHIEAMIFTEGFLEISGDMAGGFTNGLIAIFTWFGLPVGCILYYLLYKNKFVGNNGFQRSVFFAILCFSFFSEPITYTSFFLLFPLSVIVFRTSEKKFFGELWLKNEIKST